MEKGKASRVQVMSPEQKKNSIILAFRGPAGSLPMHPKGTLPVSLYLARTESSSGEQSSPKSDHLCNGREKVCWLMSHSDVNTNEQPRSPGM